MSYQRQAWRARAFAWARSLSDRLQGLPNKLTPPPFRLMQIGSAFWQSRALYAAARLDVATTLGDRGMTLAELASTLRVQEDALGRLLHLLCAMGIFVRDPRGWVSNNALSNPLRSDSPVCVRHMVLMHNAPEMSRPWYEALEQGVRDGRVPFEACHGEGLFDYMDSHPEFDALFARAMDEVEALSGDSFATGFDWSAFDRVIDIGGSKGAKSAAILRRHPHLRAWVVDRPQVIAQARAWWMARDDAGCRGRLTFVEGDVLNGPLPVATGPRDAYLLSAVLHGFGDAACIDILGRVAGAAGRSGAAIIVLELVMPERDADLASASFDMQMLMGTRGRERTLREWTGLFDAAGLELQEVVRLASFGQMLVLRACGKPDALVEATGCGVAVADEHDTLPATPTAMQPKGAGEVIRVEVQRVGTTVTMQWPVAAAAHCAQGLASGCDDPNRCGLAGRTPAAPGQVRLGACG